MFFLRNEIPIKILEKLVKIPGLGSAQMKKNVDRAKKINKRTYDMGVMFEHFTQNQWIYETAQVYEYIKMMNY